MTNFWEAGKSLRNTVHNICRISVQNNSVKFSYLLIFVKSYSVIFLGYQNCKYNSDFMTFGVKNDMSLTTVTAADAEASVFT